MKYILFETNNDKFLVPLKVVAENRANYYAVVVDGYEENGKEWHDEVNWVVDDKYEAIDWFANNSDPIDWNGNIYDLKGNSVEIIDESLRSNNVGIVEINQL